MPKYISSHTRDFEIVFDFIDLCARFTAVAAARCREANKRRPRRRGYAALHPGPDTPLWNELAALCEAHLTRYGSKANLGRILGVPRQRIHKLLVAKTACADAERTLQLLGWLAECRKRSDLGARGAVSSIR